MVNENLHSLPDIIMWKCILIRCGHLIWQYSGDSEACSLNTKEQNDHNFENSDITGTSWDNLYKLYRS